MNGGIDLSCAKKIIIGTPYTANCPSDKEYNAGLCYHRCKAGYYGVGPVCWANTPKGWVGCGMGAAKDSKVCAGAIFGQIASVGEMALNIGTMVVTAGGSAGASVAAKTAAKAGKLAKLKAKMLKVKEAFLKSDKIKQLVDKAKNIKNKVEKANKFAGQVE
jgi:hypothetical protein